MTVRGQKAVWVIWDEWAADERARSEARESELVDMVVSALLNGDAAEGLPPLSPKANDTFSGGGSSS